MTSLADRTIAALQSTHDELATVVAGLSEDQLGGPSGASEWTVAQVLSHLGSGAEIMLGTLQPAIDGGSGPAQDANQLVWDRWNAMSPAEQATGFVQHDEVLLAALQGLSAEQRESLSIDLGFTPAPLSLAGFAAMRLNEAVAHSWDVRVAASADAALAPDAAAVLAEHYTVELGFLLGFIGKANAVPDPAVVDIAGAGYALVVADTVSLTDSVAAATATFTGPLESAVRLISGRLTAEHTPADVSVTGSVTLEDLRNVFPGY